MRRSVGISVGHWPDTAADVSLPSCQLCFPPQPSPPHCLLIQPTASLRRMAAALRRMQLAVLLVMALLGCPLVRPRRLHCTAHGCRCCMAPTALARGAHRRRCGSKGTSQRCRGLTAVLHCDGGSCNPSVPFTGRCRVEQWHFGSGMAADGKLRGVTTGRRCQG